MIILTVIMSLLQTQEEGRLKVRQSLTPGTAQLALQNILPYRCKKQYTVVILMPRTSHFKLLHSFFRSTTSFGRDAKVSYSSQICSWIDVLKLLLNCFITN